MSNTDPSIDGETRISRNPRVTFRDVQDGGVLLHLDSGAYHGLNRIGSFIWKELDATPTFDELVSVLRGKFTDPPPQLDSDVAGFVSMMRERDLIRVAGA